MLKILFTKIISIKLFIVLSFSFFLGFAFISDVKAACYCSGNYCFTGCSFCPAGSDFSVIKIRGSGPGSCTPDSTCTITNGNMVGCTPQTFSYDVTCSSCTGGFFGEGLSYDDTKCIPSCSGGPGSTGDPPVDPCASNSTLDVRIMYDANGNNQFDDGDSNYIQGPSHTCGAFRTVDGFKVAALGGSNPWYYSFNNKCGDGIPNQAWRPVQKGGRYDGTIRFSDIPAGYKITKVLDEGRGSCREYNTVDNSVDCAWCKWKRVTFLATNAEPNWCNVQVNGSQTHQEYITSTGASMTVTVQGRVNTADSGGGREVRFWVARRDGKSIPGGDGTSILLNGTPVRRSNNSLYIWTDGTDGSQHYTLRDLGCDSSNRSTCGAGGQLTLPAGDYNVHCDAWTDPGRCSGSYRCDYYGGTSGCTASGWQKCDDGKDHAKVDIDLGCPVVDSEAPPAGLGCSQDGKQFGFTWNPMSNSNSLSGYRVGWGLPGSLAYNNYGTVEVLTKSINPDTNYRWRVQGIRPYETDATGYTGEICTNPAFCESLKCNINLIPSSVSIDQGDYRNFISSPSALPFLVPDEVRYTASPLGVVGIETTSSSVATFDTKVTATGSAGSTTTLTAKGYIDGLESCEDTSIISVNAAPPWWQVVDADVWSSGLIDSNVPSGFGDYFDEEPSYTPGYPGIPVYNNLPFNIPSTLISTEEWNANSDTVYNTNSEKRFDYKYFWDNLPLEVRDNISVIGTDDVGWAYFNTFDGYQFEGYDFYKTNGSSSFTLRNGFTLNPGKKIIVFVDADSFSINGNGTDAYAILDYGDTFMMFIVGRYGGGGGDIQVEDNDDVRRFDGIIVTNGSFATGGNIADFEYNGTVVAWDGVILERDLADDYGNPAETFIYRPQMLLNVPPFFGLQTMRWREVQP